jgi:hypothetical protein
MAWHTPKDRSKPQNLSMARQILGPPILGPLNYGFAELWAEARSKRRDAALPRLTLNPTILRLHEKSPCVPGGEKNIANDALNFSLLISQPKTPNHCCWIVGYE